MMVEPLRLGARSRPPVVTVAILAKDKAHVLPRYLRCIEEQTWPRSATNLYVRTNNNNDSTEDVLLEWLGRVRGDYNEVFFDGAWEKEKVERFAQHEWNEERFRVLGAIRQRSMTWAADRCSDYLVADCDNLLARHAIESLVQTGLPIVAPLLESTHNGGAYSNYHAAVDERGYYADCPLYWQLLLRAIRGLVEVPVVHCTYLVRREAIPRLSYLADGSGRHEYVIFSESARRAGVRQYLDTRDYYGHITFAEDEASLAREPWIERYPLARTP